MANLQEVTVGELDIADGALTAVLKTVTSAGGTTVSVTNTTDAPNPAEVWVHGSATGAVTITRIRSGADDLIIGRVPVEGGKINGFGVDPEPLDGDVWTASGFTSGTYRTITAFERLR